MVETLTYEDNSVPHYNHQQLPGDSHVDNTRQARSQGGGSNPQKDFLEMGTEMSETISLVQMHHFNTKIPQITVCCKISYDIVFILLSVQNLESRSSGKSSKMLPKDARF